ncbi:MAG: radical SAM protein [Ideonella sp.]|nr:radical SAM protein [Ideonella sp.]
MSPQGVDKIRLTGGEPLARKDAADIIQRLSKYPVELTMTTNASRIHDFIDLMQTAGMRSVNVSLDSLHRYKFHQITKRDIFEQVWANIQRLLEKRF